jgi:hypothetical protein
VGQRDHEPRRARGVAASTPTARSSASPTARRDDHAAQQGPPPPRQQEELGFKIDPVSGYWAKNEDEEDDPDPTASPRQWIVPSVQDHKNALLAQPRARLSQLTTLATLQHALLRGIEAVFQLEEGEILAEPMPTRDVRNGFLLYEATEGGAGVLSRLVAEPDAPRRGRAQGAGIMHFDLADDGLVAARPGQLVDEPTRPASRPATAA